MGMLLPLGIHAQDNTLADPDAAYFNARDLAFAGKSKMAQDTLKRILEHYPKYSDVRTLLGKTYSWEGNYGEARRNFNMTTSNDRGNVAAWVAAIKNEQYAKNDHIALGLANKGLIYLPGNTALLALRTDILKGMAQKSELQQRLIETKRQAVHNQAITVYTQAEVFDQVLDPMYYMALEYKRQKTWGVVLPKLNLDRRFNINGIQAQVDVYPRFTEKWSGYFNAGFSPSDIFPRFRAGAEAVKELPNAMEASLGLRYLSFQDRSATILTGSLGLYRGNYYLVVRPFVVPSGSRGVGVSGNLLARKYGKDGNHYWGLNISYGFDTELNRFIVDGQLLSETLLYLEAQRLRVEHQFTAKKGGQQYRVHLGANRQELGFSSGSFFLSVTAGVDYQIKFGNKDKGDMAQR